MRSLYETIQTKAGKQAPALLRYLSLCGLNDWQDLTKANLNDFRDLVLDNVAQSSARTYFAVFKAILRRYEDDIDFCKDFADILTAKNEKPVKTFLTMKELERLEQVEVKSDVEQYVLDEFLIGSYTGMRISDAREVSEENLANDCLSYVSIKTGVHAVVPLKPGVAERIQRVQANDFKVSLPSYNEAIRRLCQRAGLTERVKVFSGGVHKKGEKWQFASSHTARVSFATNLANLGVPLFEISKMMGHTSVEQTERYLVRSQVELSSKALKYFQ